MENASRRLELVPIDDLAAAHLHRRVAAVVELDPAYGDVICRRWQTLSGETPVRLTGEVLGPHDFTVRE